MPSVDFSQDIGARVGATLRDFGSLAPDAERILRQMRLDITKEVINIWPEDTGTSRAAWEIVIDGMMLIFRNPVEYVSYVFQAGDSSQTPIVDFLEAKAAELVAAAVLDLRRLLAMVPRQRDIFRRPSRAADPIGRARAAALFATTERLFRQRGARERLRERFSVEPDGRARARSRRR